MTATMDRPDAMASGSGFPTVASRVRDWADKLPDQVAMREKDYGVWQEYT